MKFGASMEAPARFALGVSPGDARKFINGRHGGWDLNVPRMLVTMNGLLNGDGSRG
jgi:hypothetical protein